MSGEVTVDRGYTIADGEKLNNSKLRQMALPVARVAEKSIGERELIPNLNTILDRSEDHTEPGIYRSSDFVPGIFNDGVGTVGSTTFTSDEADFSVADEGGSIWGTGIPRGTTLSYLSENTVTLSQPVLIEYSDGATSDAGLTLTSATAQFTPEDTGRTIIGIGIVPGTTITYVDAQTVTLSEAAPDGETGIVFHVNGRSIPNTKFTIVGRGRGWRAMVDTDGTGTVEIYRGTFAGTFATGSLFMGEDGYLVIGTGEDKLVISPQGDFVWGSAPTQLGITSEGKLFIGAESPSEAIVQVSSNGDVIIQDPATANHDIGSGALNPLVRAVTMEPAGGAIVNPTIVTLECDTHYSRIYYRAVAKDGVSNTDTSWVSATGNFSVRDVGKIIVGTDIAAGTYIKSVTNSTTIVLSQATTGTGTGREFYVVPDVTDTLYDPENPISLSATRNVAARAYKNGEYSEVTVNLFTLDSTTVPNPTFSPPGGSYGGSALDVTLADTLAGAAIFYTKDGTTPAHDGAGAPTGTTIKIAPANSTTPPSGSVHLMTGTTTIKQLAWKSGVANPDSSVVSATYVISSSSGTKVATPTFTPNGFTSPGHATQTVTIKTLTAGKYIRFTKDGSKPTRTHGTPINASTGNTNIQANTYTVLKAMAYDPNNVMLDSDVKTGIYDFTPSGGNGGL